MVDTVCLSMADLEAFDPEGRRGREEERFCCPLPACSGKPIDGAHRSFVVNTQTCAWKCHRCGAAGMLTDSRESAPRHGRRDRSREVAKRTFSVGRERKHVDTNKPATATRANDWRKQFAAIRDVEGTPGEAYIVDRGIPIPVAQAAHVKYSSSLYGRPAVVFPVRDAGGKLVAIHGRHIDDRTDPKSHTGGRASLGVFATSGAWKADPLILTEGPFDAVSLATCGYPAIALVGKEPKGRWLPGRCALRRVLVATDADEPGDQAAAALVKAISAYGADVSRLRPDDVKDWNDLLMSLGIEAMKVELLRVIGPPAEVVSPQVYEPAPVVAVPSFITAPAMDFSVEELAERIRERLAGRDLPIRITSCESIVDVERYAVAEAVAVLSRCRLSATASRDRLQRLGLGTLFEPIEAQAVA